MEIQESTREQLIAKIAVLEEQVMELKESEARSETVGTALRVAKDSFQLFFQRAPVGITVTDVQGDMSASNKAIQELVGYTSEN